MARSRLHRHGESRSLRATREPRSDVSEPLDVESDHAGVADEAREVRVRDRELIADEPGSVREMRVENAAQPLGFFLCLR